MVIVLIELCIVKFRIHSHYFHKDHNFAYAYNVITLLKI